MPHLREVIDISRGDPKMRRGLLCEIAWLRELALPWIKRLRRPAVRLALWVLLPFHILPATAHSQSSCKGIHVNILNIKNNTGTIACTLFESKEGFPREYLQFASNIVVMKIQNTRARCDFECVAPGTYALAVIHDENRNGKLDVNALGIPTEGYGFSNDAKVRFGAPSFSVASFPYNGQNLNFTISLHY